MCVRLICHISIFINRLCAPKKKQYISLTICKTINKKKKNYGERSKGLFDCGEKIAYYFVVVTWFKMNEKKRLTIGTTFNQSFKSFVITVEGFFFFLNLMHVGIGNYFNINGTKNTMLFYAVHKISNGFFHEMKYIRWYNIPLVYVSCAWVQ